MDTNKRVQIIAGTPFILTFAILFIGRLSLLGQGHMDDTDEIPFLLLIKNFNQLTHLDADAWNDQVFLMWSTYIETFIRVPQVFFLQLYSKMIALPIDSTQSLAVISFFNVLISIGISFVFYKILIRLRFTPKISLLGIIILASFINSNLYIRHIISYDSSLLFHLLALYILLKDKPLRKDYIYAGLFTAIGFFDYYGYYMMFFIIWIIGIFQLKEKTIKSIIFFTFYLAFPSFIFLGIFTYIASLSGESYLDFLKMFSTTIYHGSSEEALSYFYIYLKEVEKGWGILALFSSILGCFYLLFHRQSYSPKAHIFFISGVLAYLTYAIYAQFTQGMVFYGRVLHMYFPFFIIPILAIVQKHQRLIPGLSVASLIVFCLTIYELREIAYPRSTLYQLGLLSEKVNAEYVYELQPGIAYDFRVPYFDKNESKLPHIQLSKTNFAPAFQENIILKNFGFFFHYPDSFINSYKPFSPSPKDKSVFNKLHFMSHPAYTFEYCTKGGREFFLEKKIMLEIYQRK